MKTFKTILLFSTLLFLLTLSTPPTDHTLSETISDNNLYSIQSHDLAESRFLVDPYKTVDVFISEEKKASFDFTSVGGAWEEFSPNGTSVEAEVQFKVDGKWSEWLKLDEDTERTEKDTEFKYSMASSDPAQAFKYKYLIYGDGNITPVLSNIKWTFIKSGTVGVNETPEPQYSSSNLNSNVTYLALNNSGSKVVSRKSWGADESLRYLTNNNPESPQLVNLDDDFFTRFKSELKLSKIVKTDKKGNTYTWPLQYPTKVTKVFMHHTATTKNLSNPKQAIKDIYYYHTVTRGWGDIGYNYIVDTKGTVYEGRYGGEGVIGAHTGPGNNGSIGIAVLGNYDQTKVPDSVMKSLTSLVAEKSKLHGIDANGFSKFRGENSANILGHKDMMATSCPGKNLYAALPVIRKQAASGKSTKKKFTKDYDYENVSDTYYVDLTTEDSTKVTIELENIGKKTWNSDTFIVVNKDPGFDGFISFPTRSGAVLAKMNEKSVKSGKTASFTFTIKPNDKSTLLYMNIAPVINGNKKIDEYIILPVSIQQTSFEYEYLSMLEPPEKMEKGEEFELWVKLKNTGTATWYATGENPVHLGTAQPQDSISKFMKSEFTRIGHLENDIVKPGEIGKFKIKITAPETPGTYKQYFAPVVEGKTWMMDVGMNFSTTVTGGPYAAELISQSSLNFWEAGKSYKIWVKLRNLGSETWKSKDASISIVPENIKATKVSIKENKVETGDYATFEFTVTIDKDASPGPGKLLITPKVNKQKVLESQIYSNYSIGTKVSGVSQKNEEEIRVKLASFSGSPIITSATPFNVYSGSEKLLTVSSNESIQVKLVNGKYWFKHNDKIYLKQKPIRFSGTILEIKNFEHRPAWNTSLNDNKYRDTLEVATEDGKLILINELPLENYLKGLGEVSNSEQPEKIKSIIVAARSYAKWYTTKAEKFPGKSYHLDDNPDVCQKYIGYGFELRAANIAKAVDETSGQVVTYKGDLVKTPYFNQSDGTKTRSAKDVWNWDAPFLLSVDDSFCDGDQFLGHGVGMSGCGAKKMAELGYDYNAILKHYYSGVQIEQI